MSFYNVLSVSLLQSFSIVLIEGLMRSKSK